MIKLIELVFRGAVVTAFGLVAIVLIAICALLLWDSKYLRIAEMLAETCLSDIDY